VTRRFAVVALTLPALTLPLAARGQGAVPAARVDSVFRAYDATTPGCSVGISQRGQVAYTHAYGLADLEHDVPNTAETIFEAGSVSKQLTAASVVLLALDGKLSLDDNVRKYLPELPTYDAPITIRHLLNHTSGLRDWGNVASIGGWPRGTRTYTNDIALDIASHQRSLNYTPSAYWSYTNTGYNLLAVIVGRVSGMPLAEFTRTRIFEPLGMRSTSWRDDFTRVVKGRAIAYGGGRGAYRQDMPFENAYGNGGLLTTPTDLLRFTANLESGAVVGGPRFVEEMHRQARLTGGRTVEYASGLFVSRYRGLPEVNHSGATAGYRAFLSRYPAQGVAVAVLCNAANANATTLAHQVADLYLGDAILGDAIATNEATNVARTTATTTVPTPAQRAVAGTYRSTRDWQPYRIVEKDGRLTTAGGAPIAPLGGARFQVGTAGPALLFDAPRNGTRAAFRLLATDGDTVRYEPVATFAPTAAQLAGYAGRYTSDEAEATFTVAETAGALVVTDRYGRALGTLSPLYPDAFDGPGFGVRFLRDPAGRVTGLSVRDGRVWDLRFARQPARQPARQQ
jgi:CubicO group peptidase (beta-lactamase class C family)